MSKNFVKSPEFYGATTVGDKGQVVIPVQARKQFHLKSGEKLLVFGTPNDMLIISKLVNFQKLATLMTKNFKKVSKVINKRKK